MVARSYFAWMAFSSVGASSARTRRTDPTNNASASACTGGLDVLGVGLVLDGIAGVLALEVDFVLLHVGVEHVVGRHAEDLRHGDEEVEEVDALDTRVLLVEFLVLRPPFPRHAVDELGHFLTHGTGVV